MHTNTWQIDLYAKHMYTLLDWREISLANLNPNSITSNVLQKSPHTLEKVAVQLQIAPELKLGEKRAEVLK